MVLEWPLSQSKYNLFSGQVTNNYYWPIKQAELSDSKQPIRSVDNGSNELTCNEIRGSILAQQLPYVAQSKSKYYKL